VVDGIPKLIMISTAIGGDRLPCTDSYCILASGPEGWSLVLAEHNGSTEDLHDCLILFSARARNSLDSELWQSGHHYAAAVALLPMLPELLVSQVPRPQSRMVPPPEESRAATPTEAARPLALVVQWANIQCSSSCAASTSHLKLGNRRE
jgi:hypothetical protein